MTEFDFFSSASAVNLTVTTIIWMWGSVMVWRGAFLGARGHMKPRLFVAMAMTGIATFTLLDLLDFIDPVVRADGVRGCGWVLGLALGFTAITGIKYGRKVHAAAEVIAELHRKGDGES